MIMSALKSKVIPFVILNLLVLTSPNIAHAFDQTLDEVGLSYGFASENDVSKWIQVEAITRINFPYQTIESYLKEHDIQTLLDLSFAQSEWHASHHKAYHAALVIMLRSPTMNTALGGVFYELGTGPHLITNPEHTNRLATTFEFSSHIGLGLELSENWVFVTRARHISNGGFKTPNPGVNIIMLQLHYQFDE
ncbi:MAG: acyloxyacyl hydrolase [Ghiorsea sp.]